MPKCRLHVGTHHKQCGQQMLLTVKGAATATLCRKNKRAQKQQAIRYALLGPSGCGKTSLLRCLLSQIKLDDGYVLLFGKYPGVVGSGIPGPNVGYMSQEASVYHTLNIFEHWMYYGRLLGVSKDNIIKASSFLIEMLHLPPGNTLNGNLSCGQLRRVAFGAAILHNPKLLILDEPTVGIDLITKDKMWQYLLCMTKENGTSIILTTHYIDEARIAHCVGLMHRQTLAVEGKTSDVLEQFNCISLEDVYLMVCSDQTKNSNDHPKTRYKDRDQAVTASVQWRTEFTVRWPVLQAVMIKNFIHLFRFPGAIASLWLLPSVLLLFTMICFGELFHGIELVVLNEDVGSFGYQYLTFLDRDFFHLEFLNSSTDLQSGRHVQTYLNIQRNFTETTKERIWNFPLTDEKLVYGNGIQVNMDQTEPQISLSITFHLLDAFLRFQSSLWSSSNTSSAHVEPLISMEAEEQNHLLRASSLLIKIAVLTLAPFFSVTALGALGLFTEKRGGHLECSRVAGVSSAEIILGLVVTAIVLSLGVIVLLMIIVSVTMPNVNSQNGILICALLLIHGFSAIGFGFFLAAVVDEVFTVLIALTGSMLISLSICGYFWPVQAAPYFYQVLIRLLPHFYVCDAINALLHLPKRDNIYAILRAFSCDLIWFVIFQIAAIIILMKKKK